MRFLCLHGMGTNAQIFEAQLAQIRSQLVGQHEFIFPDGEVECEPAPGIEAFYPGPYYCFYDLPIPEKVQAAFDLIDEILEDEGPFDGVIGFSQGAALASSYILQDFKLPVPKQPFQCAIFFNASMPFDLDSTPFTVSRDGVCRYADTKEPIENFDITSTIPEATSPGYCGKFDEHTTFLRRYSLANIGHAFIKIPTTHVLGAIDGYNSQGLQLRKLCILHGQEFIEHRGGHEIPKDRNTTMKTANCIQNMFHTVLVG